MRGLRRLAIAGVLIAAAGASFLLVAMRTKSPSMLRTVRRFNKAFTNRLQLKSAGAPGAYASILRHRGRRSGRMYETPIVPFATDDGFVIGLPYGPQTDWVENVLASGSAELVTGGQTYTLTDPEVIPVATIRGVFPASEQRTQRMFGVEQCLRLRRIADLTP